MATDLEKMFQDYLAAWNSHNAEKIASFFTDDCVYEDAALAVVNQGREELKALAGATFASFSDINLEVTSFFAAGEWAGSEWIMSGTHTGDAPNLPATGKGFSIRGASITEVQQGKIRRNTDYWNVASLLQQLGFMPETSSG